MDVMITDLYSSLVRNALGQRTQYTHPNGMRTEYAYDKADNMTSKIKYDAQVYNRFYDTDEYSPWTPISGTWQLVDGAVGYVVESGTKAIYASHSAGDQETWFSFKRVGALDNAWDHVEVRLRNVDANNYLDLYWADNEFMLVENGNTVLTLLDSVNYRDRLRIKPFFCVRKCDCSVCLAPQKRDRLEWRLIKLLRIYFDADIL